MDISMKSSWSIKLVPGAFPLLLLVSLFLAACGSGGSSSSSSQAAVQATAVAGIAAAGAPLAGKVHLSDSSFKIYSSTSSINRDGSFSFDTTGMTAPFILRATDATGNDLYSFAKAPGIVNINPLTNLAVAVAAENRNLSELYANHTNINIISRAIPDAVSNVMLSLKELLACYKVDYYQCDPLYGPYQVNKQGLDGLFDDVSFTVSGGLVTIKKKDTQTTPIFNGVFSQMSSSKNNLPARKTYVIPGNAELTLKVQGSLPSGTLIKNVIFSVQLPLGISVTLDPNDLEGLNAVENTAIPIGTATGSNVYPTPAFSAVNNILTVSMTSVAGFSVGDFIKIRCIVSTPSLAAATSANSFSVIASQFYPDIYKNTKLKGLTIVPDKFAALQ